MKNAKRIIVVIVVLGMVFLMTSCGEGKGNDHEIGDNTYIWEKEGFGGEFTISLNSDGTFQYSVGPLSSHFGTGKWVFSGGTLVLEENEDTKFYFTMEDWNLVFVKEGSSQFENVAVEDGDRFLVKEK